MNIFAETKAFIFFVGLIYSAVAHEPDKDQFRQYCSPFQALSPNPLTSSEFSGEKEAYDFISSIPRRGMNFKSFTRLCVAGGCAYYFYNTYSPPKALPSPHSLCFQPLLCANTLNPDTYFTSSLTIDHPRPLVNLLAYLFPNKYRS